MNIYGYEKECDELLEMAEITLQADIEELREMERFLKKSIELMEKHGEEFGHEHFSDFTKKQLKTDVIIAK